jgi:hypothetical protein
VSLRGCLLCGAGYDADDPANAEACPHCGGLRLAGALAAGRRHYGVGPIVEPEWSAARELADQDARAAWEAGRDAALNEVLQKTSIRDPQRLIEVLAYAIRALQFPGGSAARELADQAEHERFEKSLTTAASDSVEVTCDEARDSILRLYPTTATIPTLQTLARFIEQAERWKAERDKLVAADAKRRAYERDRLIDEQMDAEGCK